MYIFNDFVLRTIIPLKMFRMKESQAGGSSHGKKKRTLLKDMFTLFEKRKEKKEKDSMLLRNWSTDWF